MIAKKIESAMHDTLSLVILALVLSEFSQSFIHKLSEAERSIKYIRIMSLPAVLETCSSSSSGSFLSAADDRHVCQREKSVEEVHSCLATMTGSTIALIFARLDIFDQPKGASQSFIS